MRLEFHASGDYGRSGRVQRGCTTDQAIRGRTQCHGGANVGNISSLLPAAGGQVLDELEETVEASANCFVGRFYLRRIVVFIPKLVERFIYKNLAEFHLSRFIRIAQSGCTDRQPVSVVVWFVIHE